jgi:hypothetical protein
MDTDGFKLQRKLLTTKVEWSALNITLNLKWKKEVSRLMAFKNEQLCALLIRIVC